MQKKLEKLNLEPKEAKVYLALLELGETSIERISKRSKIKRTTVYDVINSLKEKGLIGTARKGKRILYFAEDPREIGTQLEEKKNVFESLLPGLLSIYSLIDKKPKVTFFEGVEGIKNVYKDTLSYPDQEILMWGATEMFKYFDSDFSWNYYLPKRIEKKIWMRAIGPDEPIVKEIQAKDAESLRKTKTFPRDKFSLEVEINLYGNGKIGIMSFKEQLGIIIESRKIYNTLKNIFEMNWKMLP